MERIADWRGRLSVSLVPLRPISSPPHSARPGEGPPAPTPIPALPLGAGRAAVPPLGLPGVGRVFLGWRCTGPLPPEPRGRPGDAGARGIVPFSSLVGSCVYSALPPVSITSGGW